MWYPIAVSNELPHSRALMLCWTETPANQKRTEGGLAWTPRWTWGRRTLPSSWPAVSAGTSFSVSEKCQNYLFMYCLDWIIKCFLALLSTTVIGWKQLRTSEASRLASLLLLLVAGFRNAFTEMPQYHKIGRFFGCLLTWAGSMLSSFRGASLPQVWWLFGCLLTMARSKTYGFIGMCANFSLYHLTFLLWWNWV